jgi:ABC-type dipeptide/oligopeptide/nickel transport system permease subunit
VSIDRPADELSVHDAGADGLGAEEIAALELTGDEAVELDSLHEVGPSRSLASDAWRRFKRNRLALFGLCLVVVLVIVGLIGPFFVQDPTKIVPYDPNVDLPSGPSSEHWLGLDPLGRDVLARIVYGIRLSLMIGFLATAVETIIGVFVGATAGWFGKSVDTFLMRFVDIVLGIPYLVLALALITIVGRGVFAVVVTLALTAWLQTARTVRAGFLQTRELEYIEAAKAVGVPSRRIVTRHILPNVFQPVVVLIAVGIGSAILAEAALSFLGVGVQDPDPSLGKMIDNAQSRFIDSPTLLIFPSIATICAVLGFLLVGDGLRDALDVKDA